MTETQVKTYRTPDGRLVRFERRSPKAKHTVKIVCGNRTVYVPVAILIRYVEEIRS